VAIVARALGIAAVGEIANATGVADPGDAIIVDGSTGDVHVRPTPDMEAAYIERVRLRARRQLQYLALRDKPCMTKDGEKVALMLNAGLAVDLPHIDETGAAGIGLFRTELQFMVAASVPRSAEQFALYRAVLDAAGDKPVTFRTLDIGGDKVLPYMRNVEEENPWAGAPSGSGSTWPGCCAARSARCCGAAGGRDLKVMFPMIATVEEFDEAKSLVERELTHLRRHSHKLPERVEVGTMVEVPSCSTSSTSCSSASISSRSARTISCSSSMPPTAAMRAWPSASTRCRRDPARVQGDRGQGPRPRQAGNLVRRACLEADRGAGTGRDRLPLAVACAFRGGTGQGHAPRSRCGQGRGADDAPAREPGRQREDPRAAQGVRGRAGAADLTAMLPEQKLDALVARHQMVEHELASHVTPESYVKLSREFAELEPIVETVRNYRGVVAEIDGLNAMMADSATDPEMRAMAAAEKPQLEQRRAALEHQLMLALLPKDAMDERNVILEIRAGTGGDEAALFAGDLFRMYERYAAKQGWKTEVMTASEGTKGGYKEIVAEISGRGPFAKLKFNPACIACSASPTPRRRAAFTPRPPPWRCCRRSRMSTSRSGRRPQGRHHARGGRRPARQQDRIGDPHHAPSERHSRGRAGGALPAQEPRQGDGDAARQALDAERTRRDAAPRASARPDRLG
jgi:hypothetical protein